jgi:cytochrome c553
MFFVIAAALSAQTWHAGAKAPSLQIQENGKPVPIETFVKETPAALLLLQAPLPTALCEPLQKAAATLAAERVRLVVVSATAEPSCPAVEGVFRAMAPAKAAESGNLRLALVDTSAILRLTEQWPLTAASLERAAKLGADWEGGRQLFITQCGHCHGEDGTDTSYAGVKTLAGISRRMSAERILEGGQQLGGVDMSSWSQKVKDTLLLYIRGL